MHDLISAKQRLSNPYRKWVREGFKEAMVSLVLGAVFVFLLTQPNGVI